jgi:hypothetical protein
MSQRNLKEHNHYVPQFWLRAFRDSKGRLFCRRGKKVSVVSSRDVMQESWLYTVFDQRWTASDELEDALAILESTFAPVFLALLDRRRSVSEQERALLCTFLGLQACRHPDVMNAGRRKANEFANLLADVHRFSGPDEFLAEARTFLTIGPLEAEVLPRWYQSLVTRTPQELREQFEEVITASPQDARLPMQDAVRAHQRVAQLISRMQLTLLDAQAAQTFILGDSPMPQFELARGFRIPLSKSVALEARAGLPCGVGVERRVATAAEVEETNHDQWSSTKTVAVGSDPEVLRGF